MSTLPHFYVHPGALSYTFGPQHPLRPERLATTLDMAAHFGIDVLHPGEGQIEDLYRVHSPEYVESVMTGGREGFGFESTDNPPFAGMHAASMAYVAGTVRAAEAVRDGAPLAFGIAGGLHHAMRARASGFCIYNDPAIACSILRERYDRVAYVDIDVHHGDGVQALFWDDPTVLTVSIHEDPRTLWPRTGFVNETGADFTALNIPVQAKATGDTWLWSFREAAVPALERFAPQAVVLQMGTDTHHTDPLAHIQSTAQDWLAAVAMVRDLGVPVVAVGGGGYSLSAVPRMWIAACLTLGRVPFDNEFPEQKHAAWRARTFLDARLPGPAGTGMAFAEANVGWLRQNHGLLSSGSASN